MLNTSSTGLLVTVVAMALTSAQKQEALRKRRALLNRYRREYYLTDSEHAKVKAFIKGLRK